MKAILVEAAGDARNMYIGEYPLPEPASDEILVKVAYTAVNRADLLQREGKYPPPPGDSPLLGLECAGIVVACGGNVKKWQAGDAVCGLLNGGGYAEYAIFHQDMALPIPKGLSLEQAAAIPEVFLTAYQALHWLTRLQAGESVLIHAGGSGVGTAAIQLVKAAGANCLASASAKKHALCLSLGADQCIDYQQNKLGDQVLDFTRGKGVDIILDVIGGPNFQENIQLLAQDGRMVMLGFLGGAKAERLNLAPIVLKRQQIIGSTLRSRSLDYKIRLSQALYAYAWPLLEQGKLRPVIDRVFDWQKATEAHRFMAANQNQGKLVMKVV
ncbi:MAG TPA: NAD(P)H-quinone oxidoreductase [Saprospiraceae bacterium]|nr:NAD(P)H-quinone oxidoreductase [Saprospiraceae bacterium]HMQ84984.1 NAD(P)H-quinone oxidoreductase [Saprospiraceae bacterium]